MRVITFKIKKKYHKEIQENVYENDVLGILLQNVSLYYINDISCHSV